MSEVRIARSPDISFLLVQPSEAYSYPYLLDSKGGFDWDANKYLVEYGGGTLTYGVKPLPSNIVDKARSLAIFLTFVEDILNIDRLTLSDEHLFMFVKYVKKRNVDNGTVKTHCRNALNLSLIHI